MCIALVLHTFKVTRTGHVQSPMQSRTWRRSRQEEGEGCKPTKLCPGLVGSCAPTQCSAIEGCRAGALALRLKLLLRAWVPSSEGALIVPREAVEGMEGWRWKGERGECGALSRSAVCQS